ncbi:Hypothetical predicted protein [Octopus vulgaris]|uniref:Ig-like domain-containing protein n=1 Tax=Octopus vulgaris TaxID=6645 RepID=A0AA36AWP0_OCTVU|nr:Hypothetical predicted protein [Octopus vulgaris]
MTGLLQYSIVLFYAPLLITSQRHKQVTVELSVLPEKPVIGEDTLTVRCQGLVNSFPDNINIYSILFFAANAKNGERTLLVNIEKNRTTWLDQQLQHHAEISRPSDDNTVVELLMAPARCSDQRVYSCSMQTSYGTFQSQTENTILEAKPFIESLNIYSDAFHSEWTVWQNTEISLTCSGKLGKPNGRFRWSFYRQTIDVFQEYFGKQIDSIAEETDNCQVSGSSVIVYKTNAWDLGLMFRCEIVSPMADKEINLAQRIEVLGLGIKNTTYPAENANTVSYAAIFVGAVIGFIAIIVLLTTGIYYGVQYKQVVLEYFQRICPWLWKDGKDTDSVMSVAAYDFVVDRVDIVLSVVDIR